MSFLHKIFNLCRRNNGYLIRQSCKRIDSANVDVFSTADIIGKADPSHGRLNHFNCGRGAITVSEAASVDENSTVPQADI